MEEQVEGSNSIKEGKENAKQVMDGPRPKLNSNLGNHFKVKKYENGGIIEFNIGSPFHIQFQLFWIHLHISNSTYEL